MKFFTFSFYFVVCILIKGSAQDPTFSQYDYNPLYVNPALTGLIPNVNQGLRINCLYRSLWTNIPSAFTTYTFSADLESPCINSGQGIIAMNDVEGEGKLRTSKIGGLYSYRVLIQDNEKQDRVILQAGTEVDFVQKKIDWNQLVFSDQVDSLDGITMPTGNVHPNQETSSYPDFHFGIVSKFFLYYHRKPASVLTLGFAVHHLAQPNESILGANSIIPRKVTMNWSWAFNLKNHLSRNNLLLGPTFLWEIQDVRSSYLTDYVRPFQTYDIGVVVLSSPLYFSLAYRNKTPLIADTRHSDALIVHVALEDKRNSKIHYRFGYSYDLTLSKLSPSTAGSHEISIQLIFPEANPICSALGLENKHHKRSNLPCAEF